MKSNEDLASNSLKAIIQLDVTLQLHFASRMRYLERTSQLINAHYK